MSTTLTPTAIAAPVVATESWLKQHERIVIITLLLIAGLFIGLKVNDRIAAHDQAAATLATQTLAAQVATNNQLAAQVAQTQAQFQALVIQLSAKNTQLQTQQATRSVALQQQVVLDKTLTVPALGDRLARLANISPSDITATGDGVTLDSTGTLQTVDELEKLPVLQSNLNDETTIATNLNTELTSANTLNAQQGSEIVGLNIAAVDKDKSCKADIASVKAQARKGKLKAFLYGAGIGVGLTVALVLHAVL